MALKYARFENHPASIPNDYMAMVQNLQSKSLDDAIDLMISRGSIVTRAEGISVLEEYNLEIVQWLKDGVPSTPRPLISHLQEKMPLLPPIRHLTLPDIT